VLDAGTVAADAVGFREDRDQDRCRFEEWLGRVGAERFQGLEPLPRRAAFVELALFGLGRDSNPALDRRIGDDDEVPGLHVRAARGGACREQAVVEHVARHRPIGELAHGAAPRRALVEFPGAPAHVVFGVLPVAGERDEGGRHGWSIRGTTRPVAGGQRFESVPASGQDVRNAAGYRTAAVRPRPGHSLAPGSHLPPAEPVPTE
jgi:hypothetical protein